LDIAFAFDGRYADFAHVSLESVLSTQKPGSSVNVWLLAPAGVLEAHEAMFRRQATDRANVHLLPADDRFLALPASDRPQMSYISNAMYLRLFLPAMLPAAVERFLYVDVDTLCLGDLSELFELPLGDRILAAAVDRHNDQMSGYGGLPGGEHLDADAPYFNSGVLLINAVRWRELRVSERCFEYLAAHQGRLRFPDQDALNLVSYGQWLQLDPQWNTMLIWQPEFGQREACWADDCRIAHFAGSHKPWETSLTADADGRLRVDRFAVLWRQLFPDDHQLMVEHSATR
jgi:lipopolysaccharide biosynthesis glycosyltransferase